MQRGESGARRTIAVWTVLLVGASLLFVPLGLAGKAYLGVASVLGAGFVALAFRGQRASGATFDVTGWAKAVFAYSIPYLCVLLVALLLDHVP